MSDFNPHSQDSMFAKIMSRLEDQDKTLARIESQTTKTNGRVTKLEEEKAVQKGKVVLIATIVPALVAAIAWMFEKGIIKLP